MTELNSRQEAFCQEYIIDFNATQASVRAGYARNGAEVTGHRLLSNPKIVKRVAELKGNRAIKTGVTAEWVLLKAKESFEFNAQEIKDRDGNPQMVNASAASKFLEICGKHVDVGAFTKEKDLSEDAPSMNITFEVRQPVDEVKTTNAKPE